jgi:hypothetical protein
MDKLAQPEFDHRTCEISMEFISAVIGAPEVCVLLVVHRHAADLSIIITNHHTLYASSFVLTGFVLNSFHVVLCTDGRRRGHFRRRPKHPAGSIASTAGEAGSSV